MAPITNSIVSFLIEISSTSNGFVINGIVVQLLYFKQLSLQMVHLHGNNYFNSNNTIDFTRSAPLQTTLTTNATSS